MGVLRTKRGMAAAPHVRADSAESHLREERGLLAVTFGVGQQGGPPGRAGWLRGRALPPPAPPPGRHGRLREAWCDASRTERFKEGVTVGAVRLLDLSGRSRVRVVVGGPYCPVHIPLTRDYALMGSRSASYGEVAGWPWPVPRAALCASWAGLTRRCSTAMSRTSRYSGRSRPGVGGETSTERIRVWPRPSRICRGEP